MRITFHRKKTIPKTGSSLQIFVAKQDKDKKADSMGHFGSEPYYISISNVYSYAGHTGSFNRDEWNEIKEFIDKSLAEYDESK